MRTGELGAARRWKACAAIDRSSRRRRRGSRTRSRPGWPTVRSYVHPRERRAELLGERLDAGRRQIEIRAAGQVAKLEPAARDAPPEAVRRRVLAAAEDDDRQVERASDVRLARPRHP